jgi:microcystin-dependent protein
MPSHSHTYSRPNNPASYIAGFEANISTEACFEYDGRGDFQTNTTGTDVAHSLMQPYVVVNYIIKY